MALTWLSLQPPSSLLLWCRSPDHRNRHRYVNQSTYTHTLAYVCMPDCHVCMCHKLTAVLLSCVYTDLKPHRSYVCHAVFVIAREPCWWSYINNSQIAMSHKWVKCVTSTRGKCGVNVRWQSFMQRKWEGVQYGVPFSVFFYFLQYPPVT